MAEAYETEGDQDLEAPEEEVDDEHEQALLHFGKYSEARQALPWEQRTFKEKANYYIDRIFLGVLVIFFLMLLGEFGYKMWYVTNGKKILEFISHWLFTQERQGQLAEL